MMLQSYDWEGALESCQRILQFDPNHIGALETLAQAQWQGGQFENVVRTTSKLLQLNPYEPGYRYTRGMAYTGLGRLTLAAQDFRTAMDQSHDPRFLSQVAHSLDAVEIWLEDVMQQKSERRGKLLAVGKMPVPGVGTGLRCH
ncbi:hypothetical protein QPK87_31390 [Kamptonema cortianum]|nr:hypothetical protein [Kamptonema cortianum]